MDSGFETEDKKVTMIEMQVDLEEDLIEKIVEYALKHIVNDKKQLINYGVNLIFAQMIESDGDILKRKI